MIATNETQSRKLLNAGIDPRTADMCWRNVALTYSFGHAMEIGTIEPILYAFTTNSERDTPAWSLSALIQLLPEHVFYRIARAHGHDVEKIFEDCVEYLCLKSDDSRKLWSATH